MAGEAGKGGEKTFFARAASGLVKEFGTFDVVIMASTTVFALTYAIFNFPWFYGFNPGANLPLALVIAAIPFAFLMVTYWAIGVIMPRAGNDYVWVSRVVNPAVGFAWSALYMFSVFATAYVGSVTEYEYALSACIVVWGYLFHSSSLVNLGTLLSSPLYGYILAAVITLGFAALAIAGARAVKGFIYAGWGISMVTVALICGLLLSTNPSAYAAKWDTVFSGHATYQGVISLAAQNGWNMKPITFYASLAAMPFAGLLLLGGNFVNAMAGEIKNIGRAIPAMLFLSLVYGVAFWSVLSTLTLSAVGDKWMYAIGYLWDNAGNAYSANVPLPPTYPLMVSLIAYPNQLLVTALLVLYLVGAFYPPFIYFWIPARYFFSWSFDRILPTKISEVNQRFRTPHLSIATITVISLVIFVAYYYTSWPSIWTIGTFLWEVCFVVAGVAAAVFPYVKKDLFASAPGWMGRSVGGVPLITVFGAITAALFAYMGYFALVNPLITPLTVSGILVAVGIVVACVVIYYASKWYHRRRGLKVDFVFKEIPPV